MFHPICRIWERLQRRYRWKRKAVLKKKMGWDRWTEEMKERASDERKNIVDDALKAIWRLVNRSVGLTQEQSREGMGDGGKALAPEAVEEMGSC